MHSGKKRYAGAALEADFRARKALRRNKAGAGPGRGGCALTRGVMAFGCWVEGLEISAPAKRPVASAGDMEAAVPG